MDEWPSVVESWIEVARSGGDDREDAVAPALCSLDEQTETHVQRRIDALWPSLPNQSMRERFKLPENKSAVVSQIISATIDEGLVKLDEQVGASRKFARYLPFWA